MKQNKLFKKLWVFMLVLSFLASQFAPVQAAKTNKVTISLNKSVCTIKKGKTVKLKAVLSKAAKRKGVKWSSSNRKVATVSKSGKVTARKKGKATITATVEGTTVKARCKITVGTGRTEETSKPSESVQPNETAEPEETGRPDGTAKPDVTNQPSETARPEETVKPESGKLLVAYFSWSGTSERIAKDIIEQTGADSFRIERVTPYSDDYNTVAYGEAKDEADNNARPPIKDPLVSVAQYDKIVLCYPIWWHTAPMTVGTFLENYDWTGKTIYPISQSASMDASQYHQSVEFIKECAKGAVVDDGLFTKDNAVIQSYIAETVLPVKQPTEQNPSSVSHIVSYANVPLPFL